MKKNKPTLEEALAVIKWHKKFLSGDPVEDVSAQELEAAKIKLLEYQSNKKVSKPDNINGIYVDSLDLDELN